LTSNKVRPKKTKEAQESPRCPIKLKKTKESYGTLRSSKLRNQGTLRKCY